jgi:uncharacterized protein YcbX
MSVVATVRELWRFPVKSFLGEQLDRVELDERGIVGDRLFAVTDRNGKLGSGKTSTRFRRLDGLFDLRAHGNAGEPEPSVILPDGRELAVGDSQLDEFLSGRYGEKLRVVRESSVSHHDAAPLHLLTTSSLRWLADRLPSSQIDRRRFRPNILLDGGTDAELLEDSWVGGRFALGSTVIRVAARTDRCVMTTNAQSELPQDPAILRAVTELNDTFLGVFADVEQPGTVMVGDRLVRL